MYLISDSLSTFKQALDAGEAVSCDPNKGVWWKSGRIEKYVSRILNRESKRIHGIVTTFIKELDRLELSGAVEGVPVEQYISIGKRIKQLGKLAQGNQTALLEMADKITALKCRVLTQEGGFPELDVFQMAIEWKASNPLYQEHDLTIMDRTMLIDVEKYPLFIKRLAKHQKLRDRFFSWVLRERNRADVFIEFPQLVQKFEKAHLSYRIGRVSYETLRIHTSNDQRFKQVTLPFFNGIDVERYNVLDDEQTISLNGGRKLKIREVFEGFGKKWETAGDLEFFGTKGIMSWDSREFGWWDHELNKFIRINFAEEEWWKQLPVMETITADEVFQRYGCRLGEGEWAVSGMASRVSLDHAVEDQHGYMDVLIPCDQGRFQICTFGKYLKKYPLTLFDNILCVMDTGVARIAYPDDNAFYSFRQHAGHPIVLSSNQGLDLMGILKSEITEALENNRVFQFRAENCAHWVQATISKVDGIVVPDFYRVNICQIEARNSILNRVIRLINSVTGRMQTFILRVFELLFGSWRSVTVRENGVAVRKQVSRKKDDAFYLPSHLHRQISEGSLPGKFRVGHY